jgi:hypothetical protein
MKSLLLLDYQIFHEHFLHSVLCQQNWCILHGCEPVSFMAHCALFGNCLICVRFELFLVRMYKVTTAGHQYDSDLLTSSLWLQNVTSCLSFTVVHFSEIAYHSLNTRRCLSIFSDSQHHELGLPIAPEM